MGQDQSVEEWKEIFNTLDVDKTGRLNLRELLCSNRPEIADSSVGFLFRFDASQEGTINFEEFQELVKHLRHVDSKYQPHKKKQLFNLKRILNKSSKSKSSDEEEFCWKTLDSKNTSGLSLGRDAATPAFTGKYQREKRRDSNSGVDSPERQREELAKREEQKTRAFLEQSFRKSEGKKKFMDWLFKLADVDKSHRISSEELELILRALAKDHINTAQLSYDEEHITPLLIQSIMGEYDIGKTGYLSKEEFMVLADLIVRNYDTLVSEHSTVRFYFYICLFKNINLFLLYVLTNIYSFFFTEKNCW